MWILYEEGNTIMTHRISIIETVANQLTDVGVEMDTIQILTTISMTSAPSYDHLKKIQHFHAGWTQKTSAILVAAVITSLKSTAITSTMKKKPWLLYWYNW